MADYRDGGSGGGGSGSGGNPYADWQQNGVPGLGGWGKGASWGPTTSHWYDPTSWDISSDADRENQKRAGLLDSQGGIASNFAGRAGAGFFQNGADLNAEQQRLQAIQSGQFSSSREMLRQALASQLAQQRSAAASSSPQNSAMASIMAARNMGQAATANAGQASLADIQERNAATQQLANMLLQERQQNLSGFLGGNSNAMNAYGAQQPQSSAYQLAMGGLGGIAAIAGAYAGRPSGGGGAASDRRLKTDIGSGDAAAGKAVDGVKAYTFRYKAEPAGNPKRLGVMAQDLQKTPGLAHTVVDTPRGKMIHSGHLAAANTAMIAHLAKRVGDLEAKRVGAKDPPPAASKRKDVGVLTASKREDIPKSEMGLPGKAEKGKGAVSGSYPMPDRKHAALAKAMASRYASPGQRAKIDAKANKILARG